MQNRGFKTAYIYDIWADILHIYAIYLKIFGQVSIGSGAKYLKILGETS